MGSNFLFFSSSGASLTLSTTQGTRNILWRYLATKNPHKSRLLPQSHEENYTVFRDILTGDKLKDKIIGAMMHSQKIYSLNWCFNDVDDDDDIMNNVMKKWWRTRLSKIFDRCWISWDLVNKKAIAYDWQHFHSRHTNQWKSAGRVQSHQVGNVLWSDQSEKSLYSFAVFSLLGQVVPNHAS